MKKNRTLIISLLLIAALALGIGYAALTDDLFIAGSAKIKTENAENSFAADVYFTKAVMSAEKGTASIGVDENNEASDKVTITVNEDVLGGKGDSVLCTLEISNVGDLDASVSIDSIVTSNDEFFTVTTSWGSNTTRTIAAGATLDLVVTIAVDKTPTTNVSTTFEIGLTATAVEEAATTSNP